MSINIVLSNFISIGMLTYVCSKFLKYRFDHFYQCANIFLLPYIIICYINKTSLSNVTTVLIFITQYLYLCIQFKDSFIKKLLIFFHYHLIISFSEFITMFIMIQLDKLSSSTPIQSMQYTYALIISNIITITLSLVYIRLYKLYAQLTISKKYWLILLLPSSTLLLIFGIQDYYLFVNNATLFICFIGFILSNIITMGLYIKSLQSITLQNELTLSQSKNTLLNQHYETNSILLHTILHKCNVVNQYFKDNNIKDAEKVFQELTSITFQEFNNIYTNSTILNSVINSKLDLLNKHRIQIHSSILYNNFNFMKISEQIDFFSLLLDIAIHETIHSNHHTILLKSTIISNRLIFNIQFVDNHSNIKNRLDKDLKAIINLYHMKLDIHSINKKYISVLCIFPI